MSKIDLRLLAGWRLKTAFEALLRRWPDLPQKRFHRGIAAVVSQRFDLTKQPCGIHIREGGDPVTKIARISIDHRRSGWPRSIDWRLQATLDVFCHRLTVNPSLPGNRRVAQALSMKIQNHHNLPNSDHRPISPLPGVKYG